jgi:putative sugar O-methyltransferase
MGTGLMDGSAAVRGFQERLEALRASAAYRNYEYVRDRVLEMRAQAAASGHRPSRYWEEELSHFEYMFDASPLVVEKLRHHTSHVTGLRAYDYRTHRTKPREQFAEKLRALGRLAASDLLVPESPLLGGFGFEIDGRLFNIDTLKYYEALIALEKGSVLDEFRNNAERRLVWEIGAGWGGFPYQFKTLCPNVTYLISDLPELFLFSATYLMTLFPQAKVRFWGEEPARELFAKWRDYDFVFVPNTALEELAPERVDLAINMVSFQEMTDEQVLGYISRAHALGSPFLYSLNKDKGPYNPELQSISAIFSRFYWPREIEVLPVGYTKMLDDAPSKSGYTHLIGWRRVKV